MQKDANPMYPFTTGVKQTVAGLTIIMYWLCHWGWIGLKWAVPKGLVLAGLAGLAYVYVKLLVMVAWAVV